MRNLSAPSAGRTNRSRSANRKCIQLNGSYQDCGERPRRSGEQMNTQLPTQTHPLISERLQRFAVVYLRQSTQNKFKGIPGARPIRKISRWSRAHTAGRISRLKSSTRLGRSGASTGGRSGGTASADDTGESGGLCLCRNRFQRLGRQVRRCRALSCAGGAPSHTTL